MCFVCHVSMPLPKQLVLLRPQQRNKLNNREMVEFNKTADQLSEAPWNLHRAADYLRGWCETNAQGIQHPPFAAPLGLSGRVQAKKPVHPEGPAWHVYDHHM